MTWAKRFRKAAASTAPEEQPGPPNTGVPGPKGSPASAQAPAQDQRQDSTADELPGENPDPDGEFFGPGDMSQQGMKQPILDYTLCKWMGTQILSGGGPAPQAAVAQTREGDILVSLEVCHSCEHEPGCYGMDEDQQEKRVALKEAMQKRAELVRGIDPAFSDAAVAGNLKMLKVASPRDGLDLLMSKGYTVNGASRIFELSKRL